MKQLKIPCEAGVRHAFSRRMMQRTRTDFDGLGSSHRSRSAVEFDMFFPRASHQPRCEISEGELVFVSSQLILSGWVSAFEKP